MSTVMFSGMSPGSTSISISRCTKSTTPPCCLTPFGLALEDDRDRDGQHLVHRDLVEVGVEQLVRDRIELVFLHEHARVAAIELETDERVDARFRVQDPKQRSSGSTAISTALPFSAP